MNKQSYINTNAMHHFTAPTQQVTPPPASSRRASTPNQPPCVISSKPSSINSSLRARSKKPLIEKTGQCKRNEKKQTLWFIYIKILVCHFTYIYIYTRSSLSVKMISSGWFVYSSILFLYTFSDFIDYKEGGGGGGWIKSCHCPPLPRLQKLPMHITIYTVCTTFAFSPSFS